MLPREITLPNLAELAPDYLLYHVGWKRGNRRASR